MKSYHVLHSQTIYGSLVETFGPYFQIYMKTIQLLNTYNNGLLDGLQDFFNRLERCKVLAKKRV